VAVHEAHRVRGPAQVRGGTSDEPERGVREMVDDRLNAVLIRQSPHGYLELEFADGAEDWRVARAVTIPEHLHGALTLDLLQALLELLGPQDIRAAQAGEPFRLEPRDRVELDRRIGGQRVADAEEAGVRDADDVAGVGLVHRLAI